MTPAEIRAEAARLETEDGPWRCRMDLGQGVVVGPESPRTMIRTEALYCAVEATCSDDEFGSQVLDLGALNGAVGAVFARNSWVVRFVDGRSANCRKLNLLIRARNWPRCAVIEADVRQLPQHEFGWADIVLCCGILYHLQADEALRLLERIAQGNPRLLVLDSQFAFLNTDEVTRIAPDGQLVRLRGQYHREHAPDATPEEKLAVVDKSLDNCESFWFHAPDLISYLKRLGFTTILQHAEVWELLPPKPGHDRPDDPRYRRMLFCYRR